MEISLKTGIEHRFSSSEFEPESTLGTFGKTKEFYGILHGILKYGWSMIQYHIDVFLDVSHEKTK